jgi:hypothetical protein
MVMPFYYYCVGSRLILHFYYDLASRSSWTPIFVIYQFGRHYIYSTGLLAVTVRIIKDAA